ncbi:hypothetical protein APHAL10511_002814 [Amanita phalloides]|nr:hypothetical protein APHAL10511_002814 [Amanita phalloides]
MSHISNPLDQSDATMEQPLAIPASTSTPTTTHISTTTVSTALMNRFEEYDPKIIAQYMAAVQKMEKLNANNWLTWKEQMLFILNSCNTYSFITGTIEQPNHIFDAPGVCFWQRIDRGVSTMIVTAIGDEQIIHVPK